jgi:hypothetical protein
MATMNRKLAGRIAAILAIGLLVAGALGASWRSLGLQYFTIELGLTRVTVCGDCQKACTGMHDHCVEEAKTQYGECNRATDCHVDAGKTVCSSKACRQDGYCSTQQKKCESKCATTPACETTSPFDAGKTLQLGPRDRHLMGLAGIGGLATLFAGVIAALMLVITAILARRTLATATLVVSAVATVAGLGFALASGMKAPVGGTSLGWSAFAWIGGGVVAIAACVLLRSANVGNVDTQTS